MQKKHWLKKQFNPVRLPKSHTKSARLPKEKELLPNVQPSQRKNVGYLRKTPKRGPLLLLIRKYRLIRRKNVRTRLLKEKDRQENLVRRQKVLPKDSHPDRIQRNALLLQTVRFSNMQKVRKKAGKKFVHVRKRNVRKKPNRYMQLTIPAHVSFLMKRMNLKLQHLIFPLQRRKKNRPILIFHQSMSVKNVNRRCVRTIRIC